MPIEIQVQNISTAVKDAGLTAILEAVQAQLNQDVAPIWRSDTFQLVMVPAAEKMDPHTWQFIVADTCDQAGAAGYHETTSAGAPIGYAFAKTTLDARMHPSVTISHELVEMAGDPHIDQSCQWSDNPNPQFDARELCDPVEDDSLGYEKTGVLVSDFVTPAYFVSRFGRALGFQAASDGCRPACQGRLPAHLDAAERMDAAG